MLSATMSSVAIFVDCRYLEEDKINLHAGGLSVHDSKLINGIRELLGLLRTLGEGYRFSCMHRSQVWKLCEKHHSFSYVLLLIVYVSDVSRKLWKFIKSFHRINIILDGCFLRYFAYVDCRHLQNINDINHCQMLV